MRLRLKSEFWAEGSGVGFHVAACKRGVFIHQYSSVLGKPTFSTESVESGHPAASQADNEGSIPFTRSTILKASSLPRFNLVSVKVSVSVFRRRRMN
jgi:hypothetical protein